MIAKHDDEALRGLLGGMEPPPLMIERILAETRRRSRVVLRGVTTGSSFDVVTSARGVVHLRTGRGATIAEGGAARAIARTVRAQLEQYLAGERAVFDVPLDLASVAPFQRRVL